MTVQRMVEFETRTAEDAAMVSRALRDAFAALAADEPARVRLAYWRAAGGGCRFVALLELEDEAVNPLLDIEATRLLPKIIGEVVDGGYPTPAVLEQIGSYGFGI